MNIRKIEHKESDELIVWINSTGWHIKVSDKEAFLEHMKQWFSIVGRTLTRTEYEEAYKQFDLGPPKSDDDLGNYGNCYGDFGMSHYHTMPENRKAGMIGTLDQNRWIGLKKEQPNIEDIRKRQQAKDLLEIYRENNRRGWPEDLQKYIDNIGGLEKIYDNCTVLHHTNPIPMREKNLHMEWLIGHVLLTMSTQMKLPSPEWWADWKKPHLLTPEHPLMKIAEKLKDRRIEPYTGTVRYFGYGEDCGDDVRKNYKDWLGN